MKLLALTLIVCSALLALPGTSWTQSPLGRAPKRSVVVTETRHPSRYYRTEYAPRVGDPGACPSCPSVPLGGVAPPTGRLYGADPGPVLPASRQHLLTVLPDGTILLTITPLDVVARPLRSSYGPGDTTAYRGPSRPASTVDWGQRAPGSVRFTRYPVRRVAYPLRR